MFKARAAMFVLTLVAALGLGTVAWGADVEGKIKSVDASGRMVTLEDGTTLTIPPDAKVDKSALKPGATVKASFEDKAGQKVVTTIQVAPAK
jgi:Cu/Ag efflux protein CusF